MISTILLAALAAGPARAADNEISLELGSLGTQDNRFNLVHDRAQMGTYGGRVGLKVLDNLGVLVDIQHGAWGNTVDVYGSSDTYYDETGSTFTAAYRGSQVLVGPKADLRVTDWFHPYVTIQGGLFFGRVLLDDDGQHTDNANQIAATAFQPGGVAALGLDLVSIRMRHQLRFGSHLELGYGLAAASSFKATPPGGGDKIEIARFGFGGFYAKWGVGAYF